jgi:hypothetical protein
MCKQGQVVPNNTHSIPRAPTSNSPAPTPSTCRWPRRWTPRHGSISREIWMLPRWNA